MSAKQTFRNERDGWAGVYKSPRSTKYSAMCYIPGPRKHVHLGAFSDPRVAAVVHDAALVAAGRTPENCNDDEYANALLGLCKSNKERGPNAVINFAEKIRASNFKVLNSKTVPSMRSFHRLVDMFLADRGKPPPPRPYKSRVKLSTGDSPSSGKTTDDSSGIPIVSHVSEPSSEHTVSVRGLSAMETRYKRASESPPEVAQTRCVRPRRARKALNPAFDQVVESTPKPEEPKTSWLEHCHQNNINVINAILLDPDAEDDEHIASWRNKLTDFWLGM